MCPRNRFGEKRQRVLISVDIGSGTIAAVVLLEDLAIRRERVLRECEDYGN